MHATRTCRRSAQDLKRSLPPFNADTAPGLVPNIIAGPHRQPARPDGPELHGRRRLRVVAGRRGASRCADLRSRECDLALVGGVHVATPAPVSMLFCQLGALSRREQIRPFDKDADGTLLGEGVGMVVLKRRADAERDGDRIYAVDQGRRRRQRRPRPSACWRRALEGEELALRRAYEIGGRRPAHRRARRGPRHRHARRRRDRGPGARPRVRAAQDERARGARSARSSR